MELFVFKVHENSQYYEGMILVAAESAIEARQHILPLTMEAVWPSALGHIHDESCRCRDPFLGKHDVVKLSRIDHVDNLWHCEWYLEKVYNLADNLPVVKGVKSISYAHFDG